MDTGLLSLLIVNAYAAAIFGRLRSLPLTFLGAVVIGCTDAYLSAYLPSSAYLSGLRIASPAILLFIVLLLIPNPRLRGRVRSREYFPSPTWPGALALAGVIVLGAAVLASTLSPADATIYVRIFPFGIFALSLVPLTGFAGRISLCQLSFAAIGASVWAQWGNHGNPLWMLGAALVAAVSAMSKLSNAGISFSSNEALAKRIASWRSRAARFLKFSRSAVARSKRSQCSSALAAFVFNSSICLGDSGPAVGAVSPTGSSASRSSPSSAPSNSSSIGSRSHSSVTAL